MSGLDLAAGIAGLLSLTIEVTSISYRYLTAVRNASKSMSDILLQLSALQTILIKFHNAVSSGPVKEAFSRGSLGPQALGDVNGVVVDSCQKELFSLKVKLQNKLAKRSTLDILAWPFQEDANAIITKLYRFQECFQTALSMDAVMIGAMTLMEVQKIDKQQQRMKRDTQFYEVLKWLSPSDMSRKQADVYALHQKNTSGWLLSRPEFLEWMQGNTRRTLWCYGNPGVGKTVLMSYLVNHLSKTCPRDIGLAYLYCDYRDQEEHTAVYLMSCFLKQLLEQRPGATIPPEIMEKYERQERPGLEDVTTYLKSLVLEFSRTLILVDALDEVDFRHHRQHFIRSLNSLQGTKEVRILVTSRPNSTEIYQSFTNGLKIEINAVDEDIREYLSSKIANDTNLSLVLEEAYDHDQSRKQRIMDRIIIKAQGMFLLAQLQLERICEATNIKDVEETLQTIPEGLEEAYRETIFRIQNQAKARASLGLRTLMWISHAKRPLRATELEHALAIDLTIKSFDKRGVTSRRIILDSCLGLITVDGESQMVRLVHVSAQEYLERHRSKLFPQAAIIIANTCVSYLSYDYLFREADLQMEWLKKSYSFILYALEYWSEHVQDCDNLPESTKQYLLAFLKPEVRHYCGLAGFCLAIGPRSDYREGVTSLHVAAARGLGIIEKLLDRGVDIDFKDTRGWTALFWAVKNGRVNIIDLLLGRGASVSIQDIDGMTVLHHAATCWNVRVLQNILKEVPVESSIQDRTGQTALHIAAKHDTLATKHLLMSEKVDPRIQDQNGFTALHYAVQRGSELAIRLLLDTGKAGVEVKTIRGENVLHIAVVQGIHENWENSAKIVDILLKEKGIDPRAKDLEGNSALHFAVAPLYEDRQNLKAMFLRRSFLLEGRREEIATHLIRSGASLFSKNKEGRTPAQIMVAAGYHSLIQKLFEIVLKDFVDVKTTARPRSQIPPYELLIGLTPPLATRQLLKSSIATYKQRILLLSREGRSEPTFSTSQQAATQRQWSETATGLIEVAETLLQNPGGSGWWITIGLATQLVRLFSVSSQELQTVSDAPSATSPGQNYSTPLEIVMPQPTYLRRVSLIPTEELSAVRTDPSHRAIVDSRRLSTPPLPPRLPTPDLPPTRLNESEATAKLWTPEPPQRNPPPGQGPQPSPPPRYPLPPRLPSPDLPPTRPGMF